MGEGYYGGKDAVSPDKSAAAPLGYANVAAPGYASEKISLGPGMVREMQQQRQRLVQRRLVISERIELLGQLLSLFEEV